MVWPEKDQKKDISWLPREKTMSMHNHFEEEEAELGQVQLLQYTFTSVHFYLRRSQRSAGYTCTSKPDSACSPTASTCRVVAFTRLDTQKTVECRTESEHVLRHEACPVSKASSHVLLAILRLLIEKRNLSHDYMLCRYMSCQVI